MKSFEVLLEIIINAGIAQGFLVALLFPKGENKVSAIMLRLLLIDLSLIVFRIHYLMNDLFDILGSQFFLTGPFMLLLGPLLFFYLRSIVTPNARITSKDLKHFVVLAAYIVILLPVVLLGPESHYALLLKRVVGSPWLFLVLQFGYYLVQTQRMLKVHRKNIEDKFSNVERLNVEWVRFVVWVFIIVLIFITIATPSLIHGVGFGVYRTTSATFFSLVLFFIAFKGLKQRLPIESTNGLETRSTVTDNETVQKLKEKLLAYMEAEKPFLNPELTLTDLAQQLEISRNQLSQVINTGIGDNFYNFVNKFRVEEVKNLIRNDAKKKYTILALASDAGFNSKSSFNNIFKRITGLTPSEYRKGQK